MEPKELKFAASSFQCATRPEHSLATIIDLQFEIAAAGTDLSAMMSVVVNRAEALTAAAGAVIEMAEGDEMVYRAASGSAQGSLGMRLKRSTSLSGRCVSTGETLVCEDSRSDPRVDREACEKVGLRSMVVVPLKSGGTTIGVLKVYSAEPRHFTIGDSSLLGLISGYLGVMLERAAGLEALRDSEQTVRRLNEQLEMRVKERTADLAEIVDRFRLVMENIDQVFWMATGDRSQMLYVSPMYEKIFGLSCESLMADSKSFLRAIHPDDLPAVHAAIHSKESPDYRDLEYRVVRPDGSVRWLRATTNVVLDPQGMPHRIVGVASDITESRNAIISEQAAREASRLKSEFLANMSHEIRTPINGVMGMANILLQGKLASEQRDQASTIVRCADNLLTIVNDILDLSKAEAGKVILELIDFDLPQVIEDVEKTLSNDARAKNLRLFTELDPGLPRRVHGDPTRLRQVLMNLANNAIKFTSRGYVRVSARAEPGAPPHRIVFEVEDTGIGIPEQARALIFQPFVQGDASTTRRFGGTGLGLSISRHLVRLMGGEISVRSREGEGSCFSVSISFDHAITPVPSKPAAKSKLPATLPKLKVLLAEDNRVNQLIAVPMLQEMGHSVVAVANGAEALDALRAAPYDLVIMDCQMPEIDGYEATRRIRRSDLPFRDVKIIAMTAHAMTGDRDKCISAGMDDYVSKPVSAADLQAVITRTMRDSQSAG